MLSADETRIMIYFLIARIHILNKFAFKNIHRFIWCLCFNRTILTLDYFCWFINKLIRIDILKKI